MVFPDPDGPTNAIVCPRCAWNDTSANAAVVPKPDAQRGALVKAYVVLAPGVQGDEALVTALQAHGKGRLAPYE